MKKLQLLLLGIFGLMTVSFAQSKGVKTETIPTPTVQCEMCKEKIEKYLSRVDGIMTVKVDYKKKQATVKYFTDRTNIEEIKTHIANVGYDAGDVKADEEAYKKLPSCCKKPE
ncbi:MAG TPA: heavy-metal-associated domain-containing protein [Parasegetibacter sp.]|jgi:mercuric ion binding protein